MEAAEGASMREGGAVAVTAKAVASLLVVAVLAVPVATATSRR
tara:strand:- start:707 stop:835 length:129 start_codon:yes stop_codon:yes gene_type:complete